MILQGCGELLERKRLYPTKPKRPAMPSDEAVSAIPGKGIAEQFRRIKKSTINTERNKVAHGRAYRPTREAAEQLSSEANELLPPLDFRAETALGHTVLLNGDDGGLQNHEQE